MSRYYRTILNAQGSSFASTNSFTFDGNTDFITMGDPTNLSFGNGTTDSPFSISCWFKLQSVGATKWLVTKRLLTSSSSNKYEYVLFVGSTGIVGFNLYDGASVIRRGRKSSAGIISDNTWYHLVGTYNGVGGTNADLGIKIYLNGVQVDNASNNNNAYVAMINSTEPFKVGQLTDGNIDELAVFDYELSASDVTTIYNSGVPNNLNDLSTTPLGWWRMGEEANHSGGTWTLTDQGSGGNNGTSTTLPAPPTEPSTDVPT